MTIDEYTIFIVKIIVESSFLSTKSFLINIFQNIYYSKRDIHPNNKLIINL